MEYVHAALLLHAAKKEINEDNIKKVLEGAGIAPDAARAKALVAALEGVDIDEAIKSAVATPVAAPAAAPAEAKKEEKKEEKKTEEEAAAGLAALFG